MNMTVWLRRLGLGGSVARLLIVVAATSALALGAAAPAEAAGSTTTGNAVALEAPYRNARAVGAFLNGTAVTMECWVDSDWTYGRYRTNRWFRVSGWGLVPSVGRLQPIRGYVPASTVVNQTRVGHC